MAMLRLVAYAAVIGAIAYWAYIMGGERAEQRNLALTQQMELLEEQNDALRNEADSAVAARMAAVERAAQYQRRYEAEVPEGEVRDIMEAVRARIDDGVAPARIAHVVAAVENESRCEPEVTSRRFIVQTPISGGSNASVAFADNAIVVSGTGVSARDDAGNPEAWFDPAQEVTVAFTRPGGDATRAQGTLPLYHSVVIEDRDHRFTIQPSDTRGFVTVTEQVCAYP
jgi:hypothetical protein